MFKGKEAGWTFLVVGYFGDVFPYFSQSSQDEYLAMTAAPTIFSAISMGPPASCNLYRARQVRRFGRRLSSDTQVGWICFTHKLFFTVEYLGRLETWRQICMNRVAMWMDRPKPCLYSYYRVRACLPLRRPWVVIVWRTFGCSRAGLGGGADPRGCSLLYWR